MGSQDSMWWSARRQTSRVEVEAFCSELGEDGERHGWVVDLSEHGFRIERPFAGGKTPGSIQVELELPAADEVMWAHGQVCFDHLRKARDGEPAGMLIRSTGVRLLTAAARDRRLLRDAVMFLRRRQSDGSTCLELASAYTRG
jgi:hypothetical protein